MAVLHHISLTNIPQDWNISDLAACSTNHLQSAFNFISHKHSQISKYTHMEWELGLGTATMP